MFRDPRYVVMAGGKEYVRFTRGQDLQSHEVPKVRRHFEVVGKIYKEALSLIAGLEHERST